MLPPPAKRIFRGDGMTLYCVLSGTDRDGINWFKNGVPVSTGSRYDTTKFDIDGYFSYGQTKATKHGLVFKMGLPEMNCADMKAYIGTYSCVANINKLQTFTDYLQLKC